jgi:hypothetical protein
LHKGLIDFACDDLVVTRTRCDGVRVSAPSFRKDTPPVCTPLPLSLVRTRGGIDARVSALSTDCAEAVVTGVPLAELGKGIYRSATR